MLLNLALPANIKVWIFDKNLPYQPITSYEKKWKKELNSSRYRLYIYSRGYLRKVLSEVFNVEPLEVPLKSDPGKYPSLPNTWGYVSISHSKEKLLLSWSQEPIGIDIEPTARMFRAENLYKRYFLFEEKQELYKFKSSNLRKKVLQYWAIKESALKWFSNKEISIVTDWVWDEKMKLAKNIKNEFTVNCEIREYQSHYIAISSNEL